jgi:hypothetical protein
VLTLPLAVYATRFSAEYDLIHAAFAIPVAAAFAVVALGLGRRARTQHAVRLGRGGSGHVRAGRLLGIVGLCLVASALVALGVYGLLEYVGTRE